MGVTKLQNSLRSQPIHDEVLCPRSTSKNNIYMEEQYQRQNNMQELCIHPNPAFSTLLGQNNAASSSQNTLASPKCPPHPPRKLNQPTQQNINPKLPEPPKMRSPITLLALLVLALLATSATAITNAEKCRRSRPQLAGAIAAFCKRDFVRSRPPPPKLLKPLVFRFE